MPGLPVLLLAFPALAAAADAPLSELPYTPGLDVAAMDRSADPCVDFFAYSCGAWLAANPIPPDQASWYVYSKVQQENRRFLWGLLEEASRKPEAKRTPEERKIGDYFAACMDEKAVEKAGARPMAPELAAVDRISSKRELALLLGRLHAGGAEPLFGFSSDQSFEDAEQVVAFAAAGGLGLPDRDDYLRDDPASRKIREAYLEHVKAMLALSGLSGKAAASGAGDVVRMETALARASLTVVEKRDPRRLWHRTPRAQLARLTPSFPWDSYLRELGAPRLAWLNVTEPEFFRAVDSLLQKEGLAAWKAYLRWHVVRARAPSLSRAFQQESFAFDGKVLRGVPEDRPRWKKCVAWTDRDLGEALGKVFVARAFPASVKEGVEGLVRRVEEAMKVRILEAEWMGAGTRKAALEKLERMRNKIGYPERWRDYAGLRVVRGDFAGNVVRAARFETRRQLAKIGKPLDRGEWQMTPPTVNAYYSPSMNDMNFPAGTLLPPLWDPRIDLAPGYGNTGQTVGHELVHGFDDEGRRFDAKGNLRDWWTDDDAKEFEGRARCIADQYARYPVVDELKINSALTLGEDLADLGGLVVAFMAWKAALEGREASSADGLSPEQRFFVGYGQAWCGAERPEQARRSALTNPHSPPRWRVNGVVANMPEFARAFSCRAGQPLAPERRCRVW